MPRYSQYLGDPGADEVQTVKNTEDGQTVFPQIRGKRTNLYWCLKAQVSVCPLSPYLGEDGLTVFRIFDGLDLIHPRVPQILAIPGHSSSYGLF